MDCFGRKKLMTIGRGAPLFVLLVALAAIPGASLAEVQPAVLTGGGVANPHSVSAPARPTMVDIGVHFIKLDDVSDPESLDPHFTAQFLLLLRWSDPRLALAADEPPETRLYEEENALGELALIWQPDISFENEMGAPQLENVVLAISPLGEVAVEQRFTTSFTADLDLLRFPFDHQRFVMKLASFYADDSELRLRLLEERPMIEPDASLPEWKIRDFTAVVASGRGVGTQRSVSEATFSIEADRDGMYYIYKVLLPLVAVVMLSWSNFWINGQGDGRIRLTFLCLLAVIAYSTVLSKYLPRLNLLTFMDAILIIGLGALAINVVENAWVHSLIQRGDREKAGRVDGWARRLVPAGVTLAMILTAVFYFS